MTDPDPNRKEMTMTPERRAALSAAGAVETTVAEFCGLSEAEEKVIEYRVLLAREARRLREGRGLTQREMANLLKVSQSRIPLIENGKTSLDAIAKAIVMLGGHLDGDLAPRTTPTPSPPVAPRPIRKLLRPASIGRPKTGQATQRLFKKKPSKTS